MNDFMKKMFSHCSELKGELEEVMQVFDDGCAFCMVSVSSGGYDFLLNVELNEFAQRQYKVNDEITFKLSLMYVDRGEVYKDESKFFQGVYGKSYAPESFIPKTYYDKDGVHEDSSAFVCGKVISVEVVDVEGEQFCHIKTHCLGCTLDLFCDSNIFPLIAEGNIIYGLFDTIGLAI